MLRLRKASERGHANLGWLDSFHSFSFGDYYDPQHMGVSNLRVINDDRIAPGGGFPTHAHKDMEIVTYVLSGALEHKDSMGNGSIIRPGDVQRMSAGRGVRHSEYNPSDAQAVHLLQIWLTPNRTGVQPGYAQRHFPAKDRRGRLALLVSPDGRDNSIDAQQDAFLYTALLDTDQAVEHEIAPGRQAYVQIARGRARVNAVEMNSGDGAQITGESRVRIDGADEAEVLLFDLP